MAGYRFEEPLCGDSYSEAKPARPMIVTRASSSFGRFFCSNCCVTQLCPMLDVLKYASARPKLQALHLKQNPSPKIRHRPAVVHKGLWRAGRIMRPKGLKPFGLSFFIDTDLTRTSKRHGLTRTFLDTVPAFAGMTTLTRIYTVSKII